MKEAGANWVIVNADTTYALENNGASVLGCQCEAPGRCNRIVWFERTAARTRCRSGFRQITSQLRDEFAQKSVQDEPGQPGAVLLSDLVVVIEEEVSGRSSRVVRPIFLRSTTAS